MTSQLLQKPSALWCSEVFHQVFHQDADKRSGLLGGFSHRSTRSFTVPGSTLHLSFIFRHFHCPLLTLLQPSWLSLSFFNYQVLPCQGEFAPAVLSACQVPRIPSLKPHIICLTSSQSCFSSQMKDHFLGKSLSPTQIGFSSFMLLECCSCITFLSQHLYQLLPWSHE